MKLSEKQKMIAIMKENSLHAYLATSDYGQPVVRSVSPIVEDNLSIWVTTFCSSRKVKQIQNNPNVIVYYFDSEGLSYVALAGRARLVNDPEKKAHYWKEGWERFYPNVDEDYILITVTPERLELFSFEYDIMGEPPTWNVPFVDFAVTTGQ